MLVNEVKLVSKKIPLHYIVTNRDDMKRLVGWFRERNEFKYSLKCINYIGEKC